MRGNRKRILTNLFSMYLYMSEQTKNHLVANHAIWFSKFVLDYASGLAPLFFFWRFNYFKILVIKMEQRQESVLLC